MAAPFREMAQLCQNLAAAPADVARTMSWGYIAPPLVRRSRGERAVVVSMARPWRRHLGRTGREHGPASLYRFVAPALPARALSPAGQSGETDLRRHGLVRA